MEVSQNKRIVLNMTANWASLLMSSLISFFLTPYITSRVGMEAYGIIGLANNFASYIVVLTVALNSMASRFIVLEIHNNSYEQANAYFSSVTVSNVVVSGILLIPCIFVSINLDTFINVSDNILTDAKWTIGITFAGLFLSLITTAYSVVYYARNILYLGALRTMESNVLRVILLVALFFIFGAKIQICAFTTFIASLYTISYGIFYTLKFLPSLKLNLNLVSLRNIRTLLKAGIWNTIGKLSQLINDGFDILLTNLFVGAQLMGIVAISKTFTSLLITFIAVAANSFLPTLLKSYAESNKDFVNDIKQSMRYIGMISSIGTALLLVYAKELYTFWLPGEDAELLANLTYLGLGPIMVSGSIYSVYEVFTVTNRIKFNSLVLLLISIINIALVILFLNFTNYGVYAIIGISAVTGVLRNVVFTPLYAAACIKCHYMTFYKPILVSLLWISGLWVINGVFDAYVSPSCLGELVISIMLSLLLSLGLLYILGLSKQEKRTLYSYISRKLKSKD